MNIPSKFKSQSIESKWYKYWQKNGYFRSKPDKRKPYTIVIPPPNVTGVLHMGHMLNNSLQDIIIRRARMKGFNACWVPGTDHASIATEAKVVAMLKEKGIEKNDISREEFLKHAWEWTHEYGGVILEQLKKLGCSCDWHRTKFTMDKDLSESVIRVFVDLYEKGLIYRGYRMVNWDPEAETTLSDEEVIYKEVNGKLYHIAYKMDQSDEKVIIATTRPETLLGDTAICINPNDKRYSHLKGKKVCVPFTKRKIPIIQDEYVSMDFGTGCLKVTPAHDINDKILAEKHNLDFIDIFNSNGTLNKNGLKYENLDRFIARKKIVKDLEKQGFLIKTEPYQHKVGTSERTNAVIEPRLSDQWFLLTKKIANPAIHGVLNSKEIEIIPNKFKNIYRHWMENIQDWNISRQLWWGHRIPAYYYGDDKKDFVVAINPQQAIEKIRKLTKNNNLNISDISQDEDVLDTWFSSWLWPITVFDGIRKPNNKDIKYYYPTQDLITGPDILFFWVARMIMSGYEYRKSPPFSRVYLTGLVRDKKGRKMSKQLGNSPDALKLIDNYGADAVRVGLMLSSSAGNDLLFDESLCQQGKNFANKIWNSYRLIEGWEIDDLKPTSKVSNEALLWYDNQFQKTLNFVNENFEKYRISDVLMSIYKLIWDDFCSWFLELVKPSYGESIDKHTYDKIKTMFENNLKILHPFMPFLSEEIWHFIAPRNKEQALTITSWPKNKKFDKRQIELFSLAKNVVAGIRNFRKQYNISFKQSIDIYVTKNKKSLPFEETIKKLGGVDSIIYDTPNDISGGTFRIDNFEFLIPSKNINDINSEKMRLTDELIYIKGFLASVEKKLSNKKFVENAPKQIVLNEKKKVSDAKEKIKILERSLAAL